MIRAVYLVAQSVVPVFLSFLYILATQPLYPSFSRSVDVIHLRPLNDQQVAGFVSKLSFVLVLLSVAGVVLARAPDPTTTSDPRTRCRGPTSSATSSGWTVAAGPSAEPGQVGAPGPDDRATGPPGDRRLAASTTVRPPSRPPAVPAVRRAARCPLAGLGFPTMGG